MVYRWRGQGSDSPSSQMAAVIPPADVTTVECDVQRTGNAGWGFRTNIKPLIDEKGRAVRWHDAYSRRGRRGLIPLGFESLPF